MRRSDLSLPNTISLFVSLLSLGLPGVKAQTPPERTRMGALSGHVYRADTGAPLSGAVLTLHLTRRQRLAIGPPAQPRAVRSGRDGAYTFSSLETNNYTIQIWPPGGFLQPQPPIRRTTVA